MPVCASHFSLTVEYVHPQSLMLLFATDEMPPYAAL